MLEDDILEQLAVDREWAFSIGTNLSTLIIFLIERSRDGEVAVDGRATGASCGCPRRCRNKWCVAATFVVVGEMFVDEGEF